MEDELKPENRKEEILGEILEIVKKLENDFALKGGEVVGENDEVSWEDGAPDFEEAKVKIIELLSEKNNEELLLSSVLEIIKDLEEEYNFGGGEGDDGVLRPGTPKFDNAIAKIKEVFSESSQEK